MLSHIPFLSRKLIGQKSVVVAILLAASMALVGVLSARAVPRLTGLSRDRLQWDKGRSRGPMKTCELGNKAAKRRVWFVLVFRKAILLFPLFCFDLGSHSVGQQISQRADSDVVLDVLKSGLRSHKDAFCVRALFKVDSMWVDSFDVGKDFSNWFERPEGKPDPASGVGRLFFGNGISGYFCILQNAPKKSTDNDGKLITERPSCYIMRGNGLSIEGHDFDPPTSWEGGVLAYEWPVAIVSEITGASSLRNFAGQGPMFFFDLDYADSFFDPYEHRSDLTLDAERKESGISVTCKLKDSEEVFSNWKFDTTGKYPTMKEWSEGDSHLIVGPSQQDAGLEFSFPREVRFIQKISTVNSAVKFRVIRWRFSNIVFSPPDQGDTEVKLTKNASISGYADSARNGSICLLLLEPEKVKNADR